MSNYESEDDFEDFLSLNIKNLENDIKTENKKYEIFEMVTINSVNLRSIYINRKNEVYDVVNDTIDVDNGLCYKNILVDKIKKKIKHKEKTHHLLGLLSYNFFMENENVKQYSKNNMNENEEVENTYFKVHDKIDTIFVRKSIHFFKDLNEIILIFIVKKENKHKKTKKIYIGGKKKKKGNKKLKYTKKKYNK